MATPVPVIQSSQLPIDLEVKQAIRRFDEKPTIEDGLFLLSNLLFDRDKLVVKVKIAELYRQKGEEEKAIQYAEEVLDAPQTNLKHKATVEAAICLCKISLSHPELYNRDTLPEVANIVSMLREHHNPLRGQYYLWLAKVQQYKKNWSAVDSKIENALPYLTDKDQAEAYFIGAQAAKALNNRTNFNHYKQQLTQLDPTRAKELDKRKFELIVFGVACLLVVTATTLLARRILL